MDSTIQIVLLVFLIFLSGVFSASETALMSLNKIKIRKLEEDNVKGVDTLQKIMEDPSKLLSTILVANNVVNIGASSIATALFMDLVGASGVPIATLVMTITVLIFGEITPKSISTNNPEKIALLICNEKVLVEAKRDLQLKNYLSENNIFLLACFMGWIYGAFIEALVVSIMYQAGKQLIMQVTQWSMEKIDDLVAHQNLGRRLRKGKEEMIPLGNFDIGDVIVINEGETIPLGGKIIKGNAKLDVYAIDGSDVCIKSKIGNEVYSGTVVTEGYLHVKTTALYEDSAMSKVLDIAMNAPMSSSHTEKIIFKVSDVYSKALIIVGLVCCVVLPLINLTDNLKYMYLGIIMLTVSGSFAYVQGASFTLLAGIAKAFSKKIAIKENSGLDDLNTCTTIIYDRFDGIETTEEEMDLFEKIKGLHKSLIIFNDGPVDLENDEYTIYNNYSVEQKLKVMDKTLVAGPVAYIGDCDKDIALLQKASVAISRGGVHNEKVQRNSDIMLTDSNFDTIIDLLKIARKQKSINIGNTFIGIVISLLVVLLAVISFISWWVACLIYILESILVLLNSQNIVRM